MTEPLVCAVCNRFMGRRAHVCPGRHDPSAPMKCFDCKETKPAEEFRLVYGKRKGPCKTCHGVRVAEWAARNPDKRRSIWRNHAENNRDRYAASNRRYYAANREERIEAQRKRRVVDKRLKTNARALLAHYVKTGKIQRKPCEKCGATSRIHGHHHDYSKPLDVTWLCSLCHGKEHRRVA